MCCSQDIKLLSYANQRLFCRLFSSACHTAATSPAQQHPHPQLSLLPHPSWQSDFFVSTPKWQHWLPDRQTDRRAGEPQITDTAFDRQQIYLNDMQIKLTSTKFRYFSFRFGALFSLCLLHSQRRRGRAECGEREGGGDGKKTTLANKFI